MLQCPKARANVGITAEITHTISLFTCPTSLPKDGLHIIDDGLSTVLALKGLYEEWKQDKLLEASGELLLAFEKGPYAKKNCQSQQV